MGVGDNEVKEVKEVIKRYEWLRLQEKVFPNNVLLNREQIAQIEPALVQGRNPNEPIVAYYSPNDVLVLQPNESLVLHLFFIMCLSDF
jgi:hypothetical protein